MRSPQPLLTPLLALLLLAVAVAALNELVRRRVGAAITEGEDPDPEIAAGARRRLRRDCRLGGPSSPAGTSSFKSGSRCCSRTACS